MGDRNVTSNLRAPLAKAVGQPSLTDVTNRYGYDNNCPVRYRSADGSAVYDLISVDDLNKMQVGGSYFRGLFQPVVVNVLTSAKISTLPLFVNNDTDTLELAGISCVFSVANGAALTAYVSKEGATSGAVGSGPTCMSGTFNLNATANTVQDATLAGPRGYPTLVINPGEQLSLKLSTSITSIAGLQITLYFRGLNGPAPAVFTIAANGDIADSTIYLNPISGNKIRKIAMRWGTAGTDGGTVTAQVEKETGTQAPAGGTIVQSAAQSVKGTANYTVFPALAASAATLTMAQTDRLSVDFVGTLTALANIIVTVFFEPIADSWLIFPTLSWDDPDGDRAVFISDGYYQLVGCYVTYSTNQGGAATVQLVKDVSTDAPGAGTDLLATAIDTNATANTPLVGLPLTTNPFTNIVKPGDRLSWDHSTTGTLAGFVGVVVLRKF